MWKYVLAWVPMVAIAIANGAFREATYGKRMSELRAHQASTLSGVVLLGMYTWGITAIWRLQSSEQAAAVGFVWVALTLAFEFLFGHYVAGHPWSRLLHDYNVFAGRVWVAIPIWVTVAPCIFYMLHR